jgi:hypothetical protein
MFPADDRCRQWGSVIPITQATLVPIFAACCFVGCARQDARRIGRPRQAKHLIRARHPNRPRAVRTAPHCFRQSIPRSRAEMPKDCWPRCAQPAKRRMTFQRVPDRTQLERLAKSGGLGGGVSAKPLAGPRPDSRSESHLFSLKYRLNFRSGQHCLPGKSFRERGKRGPRRVTNLYIVRTYVHAMGDILVSSVSRKKS